MGVFGFSSSRSGAVLLALCTLAFTGCGGGGASSGTGNTGGTGGTAATTCNTSLFSGGVRDATNAELMTYDQAYTGNTGSFDVNFTFVPSGSLTLVFGASGSLSYNGVAQTVSSICYETAVPQLVVHYGASGHVDLKTDGSFTGVGPDGTTIIKSGSIPAGTAPAAPTGVTATAASSAQIDLAWSAVNGAQGYRIYRSTTAGQAVTAMTDILGGAVTVATSHNDSGLTAGTTYYYKIVATNSSGDSAASTEVSATTTAAGGGGGGGATTGLTVPGGTKTVTGAAIPSKSITSAATISYTPLMNQNGNIITISENGVTATIYDYVDTNQIGFGVAQSGFSIGLSPSNGCATSQAGVTPFAPLCSSVGVTYDRAAGTVTFVNSPMYALVGTCDANCVVNGVLAFAPQ